VVSPAVYASEDPSCSFGNGRTRESLEALPSSSSPSPSDKKQISLRAPRTPSRVAAQDTTAVEEAARAWAKQRRESGAAESEPVPPARKGPRADFGGAGGGMPFAPPQMMMMMMMPPPPMPGGFYPPPQQQQQQQGQGGGGFYGGLPQTMMRPPPPPPPQQQQWQQQQSRPSTSSTAAPGPPAPSTKPARPAAPGSPPPAGWGKAVDSKGRTYYWNKKDKSKVSWKKPAAE